MDVRPEIQKLAQDVAFEKQANKFKGLLGLGKAFIGQGAKNVSQKAVQGVKALPGAADRAISRTGQAGIAAGKAVAKPTMAAGRAGLNATRAAGRAGAWAAKQPYYVAKDTVKAIPEAIGAVSSAATPLKTRQYYRDAASQAGGSSGFRGALRDVGGYAPDQMPSLGFGKFKYQPKSTAGQVLTELGSAAWNPRVPSARMTACGSSGYGKGQALGRPWTAATLGSMGYGAGKAGYEGLLNAPLTGDPQIDAAIPAEQRRAINKAMLMGIPNVVGGAIRGNQVDRDMIGSLVPNMASNMFGKGLDFAQARDNALATSGQGFLQNQVIGRGSQLLGEIKQRPTLEGLMALKDSDALDTSELQDSGIASTLQGILAAADPGKGKRVQTGRDLAGALANRGEQYLDKQMVRKDQLSALTSLHPQLQDPNIPNDLKLSMLNNYFEEVEPQYEQQLLDIQDRYDLNNTELQNLISGRETPQVPAIANLRRFIPPSTLR